MNWCCCHVAAVAIVAVFTLHTIMAVAGVVAIAIYSKMLLPLFLPLLLP